MLRSKKEKERKRNKIEVISPFLVILTICIVMALPGVHAVTENDEVYLLDLPQKFADAFNIPLFPAQIFTTGIIMMIFMLPIAIWSKTVVPPLFVGFVVMGLCVALTWLPVWFLVISAMVVALMFAGGMRNWLSGTSET
ncbi:MAG: hypothetical protein MUO31_04825 [Thermodesulfovibrionales bacterium]|nr:hypothetical protein [Thermodesulfovibrionales bacterium]